MNEEELKENIRKCLKIPENIDVPHYRVLPFFSLKGKIIERYAVETEENIWVILKKVNAEKPYFLEVEKEINLYIPDISSEDEIKRDNKFKEGKNYFIDVRGLGESMTVSKKFFFHPYVKLPSSNFPKGILKITDIPEILDVVRKRMNITSF